MQKWMFLILVFSATAVFADAKLAVDLDVVKINYLRPINGVGNSGTMIFKTAKLNTSNGVVLNATNINNIFDSQLFIRPNFLGFTTSFGDFGVPVPDKSILKTIKTMDLDTSRLVLDENQLNFSGKSFSYTDYNSSTRLFKFRLYCQNAAPTEGNESSDSLEIVKGCLNFLTLNVNINDSTDLASLEYEVASKVNPNEKMQFVATIKNFDFRKKQISGNLPTFKSNSISATGVYSISSNDLSFACGKDEAIETLDTDKLIKGCLNDLSAEPFNASLQDSKQKTSFYLDFKKITVKNKVLSATINNLSIKAAVSSATTYLKDVNLKCRKETDSNLLNITNVLRDCLSSSQVTIGEVATSNNSDDKTDSSNKNISITSSGGSVTILADVKFLGITARVSISGNISLDEKTKKITLAITDSRLPFGVNSVKLVMYFLKKDFVSKDIQINNNNITFAL